MSRNRAASFFTPPLPPCGSVSRQGYAPQEPGTFLCWGISPGQSTGTSCGQIRGHRNRMVATMKRSCRSVFVLCTVLLALAAGGCFRFFNLEDYTLVIHTYPHSVTFCHVEEDGTLQPVFDATEPDVGYLIWPRMLEPPLVLQDENGHALAYYPNTEAMSEAERSEGCLVFSPRGLYVLRSSSRCCDRRTELRELEKDAPLLPPRQWNGWLLEQGPPSR
jgi:hypothetical protein